MSSIKEMAIKQYISNIDFNSDDWKLSKIKEDMRKFLGEEPGVDIIYRNDVVISEVFGKESSKEVKTIEKISIVFTDLDDKYKKIDFLVGDII